MITIRIARAALDQAYWGPKMGLITSHTPTPSALKSSVTLASEDEAKMTWTRATLYASRSRLQPGVTLIRAATSVTYET